VRKFAERNLNVESGGAKLSYARKQALYLGVSIMALLLSACFPVVDKQFIALSLILGAKWIVVGRTDRINIVIKQRG